MSEKQLRWLRRRANELRKKIEDGTLQGTEKQNAIDEYVKIFYEAWL